MKFNGYELPPTINASILKDEVLIDGTTWLANCISLANSIHERSEASWLLYEEEFYHFSVLFFALLLAEKNIVIAQSAQPERINEAAEFADICIGSVDCRLIPSFPSEMNTLENNSPLSTKLGTINPERRITFFTSGSTGSSKAIHKNWYQLVNEALFLEEMWPDAGDFVLATVTHKHIYGLLYKLIWPIMAGKTVLADSIVYPEQAEQYARDFKAINFISSPVFLNKITDQLSETFVNSLSMVFCSGGALPEESSDGFFARQNLLITEVYGSTESGGIAWRQQAKNPLWEIFSCHRVEQADDETLILSSPFLEKGSSLKTDDRVALEGNTFKLLGRVDRIVKINEKRVSLDEMETELRQLDFIELCHCTVIDSPKNELVAAVVLRAQTPNSKEERKALVDRLKGHLLNHFERSLLPKKWRFVKELPYNSQGKLTKQAITELFYG